MVNRNINYTNVCYFRCQFCAFSKGKLSANLRGRPYDLALEEIQRRCREAWERGATEVCLQGGIHPDYTGATYLSICRAIKAVTPDIHIHAFSPLEVTQGAQTLGLPVAAFLSELKAAGLGTLPGTAAEILDDEVRRIICPDKITTRQWLDVIETAHGVGLRTTATIMYGHVEGLEHWARHLLRLRALQARTGGFTEFVPLPFVPMETPIYLHGRARSGPTYREAILMHAVARLALNPHVDQHPDLVGEDGARGRQGLPARRRQRSRRHADEREHHPRRRRGARRGAAARRDGGADPLDRPQARAAHDAVRGRRPERRAASFDGRAARGPDPHAGASLRARAAEGELAATRAKRTRSRKSASNKHEGPDKARNNKPSQGGTMMQRLRNLRTAALAGMVVLTASTLPRPPTTR